jgi:hypothetical protein
MDRGRNSTSTKYGGWKYENWLKILTSSGSINDQGKITPGMGDRSWIPLFKDSGLENTIKYYLIHYDKN